MQGFNNKYSFFQNSIQSKNLNFKCDKLEFKSNFLMLSSLISFDEQYDMLKIQSFLFIPPTSTFRVLKNSFLVFLEIKQLDK
jgi:hypothetical protein